MFDCLAMEVVDAQVEAWRARDAAAFASHYAPDAVVVMGSNEDEVLIGREAIQDFYGNAFLEMPAQIELTISNRITSGDYVIDEGTLVGDQVAGEAVVIYQVRSCQIVRAEILPWVEHGEGVAE
ncbi:SgcJ/EcaC family oxidoreductase [Brevundimonas aveniformis]|uniref:SgcJ/EcaC family oxidoreductase n=1 Tax=Brevundimonas aveniformis TaxID=370977 RepID=UPI00040E7FE3|nr:SgcJ/EcaC family oxidoreductase [Brevundimonas aveniformis]